MAIQNCSLQILPNTFTAIVGPNGSGKSTLLRLASLLEKPDSGRVVYRSSTKIYRNDISLRRRIAIVISGNTLFNDTVFNNVAFGLCIRGINKSTINERVHKILDELKLASKASHHARTLSTGEAQRVMLARALVVEPEYLFLDEPTASLDPVNTEIIENVLKDFKRVNGSTIVMITHNMFQAKRLADRVVFMYKGSVVEDTTVQNFFTSPKNELVKGFITGELIC